MNNVTKSSIEPSHHHSPFSMSKHVQAENVSVELIPQRSFEDYWCAVVLIYSSFVRQIRNKKKELTRETKMSPFVNVLQVVSKQRNSFQAQILIDVV